FHLRAEARRARDHDAQHSGRSLVDREFSDARRLRGAVDAADPTVLSDQRELRRILQWHILRGGKLGGGFGELAKTPLALAIGDDALFDPNRGGGNAPAFRAGID